MSLIETLERNFRVILFVGGMFMGACMMCATFGYELLLGNYQLQFFGLSLILAQSASQAHHLISFYTNGAAASAFMSFVTVSGAIAASSSQSNSGSLIEPTIIETFPQIITEESIQTPFLGGRFEVISSDELSRLRKVEIDANRIIADLTAEKNQAWKHANAAKRAFYYKETGQIDPYDDDEWGDFKTNVFGPDE